MQDFKKKFKKRLYNFNQSLEKLKDEILNSENPDYFTLINIGIFQDTYELALKEYKKDNKKGLFQAKSHNYLFKEIKKCKLSPNEYEVFIMILKHHTKKFMAKKLNIKEQTINNYIIRITEKIEDNNTELYDLLTSYGLPKIGLYKSIKKFLALEEK